MPRENKPGRIRKSTGGNKAPERRGTKLCGGDLRKGYSEKIAEVATELSWFWEKRKESPASDLGPRLNRRIVGARKTTQALIDDFALHLVESCPTDFESEAKKALPGFIRRSKAYVSAATVRRWLRLAVARSRRQHLQRKRKAAAEAHSTATKQAAAKPRRSLLTVEQLREALKPAALQVSQLATVLGCNAKTIYRMVKPGDLNRTEKKNIRRDEKLQKLLVAVYGDEVVKQAWLQ